MATGEPAINSNDARREQMLRAAAEMICERGFGETRIADVAKRAKASSGLVLYYFGSKDALLVEGLRYSEETFYVAAERLLADAATVAERLEILVRLTCVPQGVDELPGAWGLWFDLWAQAFRHPEVARARVELDRRWRDMIVEVVEQGRRDGDVGEVDVRRFAATFAALLDGLSIQVALQDPEVDSDTAFEIALDFAEHELKLPVRAKRGRRAAPRRARPRAVAAR